MLNQQEQHFNTLIPQLLSQVSEGLSSSRGKVVTHLRRSLSQAATLCLDVLSEVETNLESP